MTTSINEHPDKDIWTKEYLIDTIFNNLMENGGYRNNGQNKYVDQIVNKFKLFRIKSLSTYFEIDKNDLDVETIKQIEDRFKDCKTPEKKYVKLNGIFVEAISRIAKQAEPMILSQRSNEDVVWVKRSLSEIRELVSFRWKLTGGGE